MCFSQSSDADVVARPAEDRGSQQEGPDEHELHQVTQQPGRAADRVRLLWFVQHANVLRFSRMPSTRKTINRLIGSVCLMLCLWLLAIRHQAWVDGGWRGAHLWGCDDVIERPAGGHERGVWRHYGDWPGELTPCLSRPVRLKGQLATFFAFCFTVLILSHPSRHRGTDGRERS